MLKQPEPESVPFERAEPSYTHRALVRLAEAQHLHYLVSQNVDGWVAAPMLSVADVFRLWRARAACT
jgi:hypothetical protein